MSFDVIDFHTHPFLTAAQNICDHREACGMSPESTLSGMRSLGVSVFCGSVIAKRPADAGPVGWAELRALNDTALFLRGFYGNAYVPGFHVHPGFVKESCEEIERMEGLGVHLIGELVPYFHGWKDYSLEAFDTILRCARAHGMIVSFHSMGEDEMDKMVERHKNLTIVAAHPGEQENVRRHLASKQRTRHRALRIQPQLHPHIRQEGFVCTRLAERFHKAFTHLAILLGRTALAHPEERTQCAVPLFDDRFTVDFEVAPVLHADFIAKILKTQFHCFPFSFKLFSTCLCFTQRKVTG